MEDELEVDEGPGVAPRRSDQAQRAASTMTHNEDFSPTTKGTHAQVVGSEKGKETNHKAGKK